MTITQPRAEDRRRRRAKCLDELFTAERWTNRKIATRLGLSHTYVGRRRDGQNDMTFEDIEMFADVLKMDGAELYRVLKAAEKGEPPRSTV